MQRALHVSLFLVLLQVAATARRLLTASTALGSASECERNAERAEKGETVRRN